MALNIVHFIFMVHSILAIIKYSKNKFQPNVHVQFSLKTILGHSYESQCSHIITSAQADDAAIFAVQFSPECEVNCKASPIM